MPKKSSKLTQLTEQENKLNAELKTARAKKDTRHIPLLQVQLKNAKVALQAEKARLAKKQVEDQTVVLLGKAVMAAYGVKSADTALELVQDRKPFKK